VNFVHVVVNFDAIELKNSDRGGEDVDQVRDEE
jgi:hypothetical protein